MHGAGPGRRPPAGRCPSVGRTDSSPTPSMLVVGKLSLVLGTEQRTKALASKCQILRNSLKKGERRKRPPPSRRLRSTGTSLGRQSDQAAHKRQWHHRWPACVGMLFDGCRACHLFFRPSKSQSHLSRDPPLLKHRKKPTPTHHPHPWPSTRRMR